MLIYQQSDSAILSDEQIIDLYWQRQERAIEETDRKYKNYLYTVAYHIVGNGADCEECLNDTYLGTWNAIPQQKPNAFLVFLTVILRRVSINRYHANRRKSVVPSEMTVALSELENVLTDDQSMENIWNNRQLSWLIATFVRSLNQRRQFIFMSRYYAAEPIDAIAADLGLSRSMVNKELAAIRRALKQELGKEGYVR